MEQKISDSLITSIQNNLISRSQSQPNISTRKPLDVSKKYDFEMEIIDEPISLITFNRTDFDVIMYALMKEIFFKDKFIFFSMTIHDNEISIFVDQKIMNILLEHYKDKIYGSCDDNYNAIKIYDSHDGVDHIGIVNSISSTFTELKIPILYVNSFNNNYILIKNTYIEHAKKYMKICGGNI
jgi:hypothetical protein